MDRRQEMPIGIKLIVAFFAIGAVGFLIGQGSAVVDYEWAADVGLQESLDGNPPAIIETNRAIGLVDVIVAVPLFIVAAVGLWRLKFFGLVASWLALGINLYWPLVAWAKKEFYLRADLQADSFPISTHLMLAFFFIPSIWAIWYLYRNRELFDYGRVSSTTVDSR